MTDRPGEPMLPEEVLLTPEETAQALECTLDDLQHERDQHKGPAFLDLGNGLIRYPRANIEQAIAKRPSNRLHTSHGGA